MSLFHHNQNRSHSNIQSLSKVFKKLTVNIMFTKCNIMLLVVFPHFEISELHNIFIYTFLNFLTTLITVCCPILSSHLYKYSNI